MENRHRNRLLTFTTGGLFSRLATRQRAWAAIGFLCAFNAGFAAALYLDFVQPSQPTSPTPVPADDLKLYRTVADDMRRGRSYYDATGDRLRAGAYPVSSIFRWRLPTLTWLAASPPSDGWFRAVLITVWTAAIGLALYAQWPHTRLAGRIVLTIGLVGVAWWTFDGISQYTHELWAAGLILLSASFLGLGRRWPAVVAGLAALVIREHALLFCLAAAGHALWQKRRLETAAWAAGITAFAMFLWWHSRQVLAHLTPEELAASAGVRPWIRFGGLAFVLQTARMNAMLFYLPGWIAYLYLAASLIGLPEVSDELGRLLLVATVLYLAAFAVVGQEFNGYWGLLYAPLLPFGLAHAYPAVRKLIASTYLP